MRTLSCLALLFPLIISSVCAEDSDSINNLDLRLRLGGGGGITEMTNEATDTDTDYRSKGGALMSVHVLYLRARPGGVGFNVGGGLFSHTFVGELANDTVKPETTVYTSGLEVTAAFVYRPTYRWHFELPAVVISSGNAQVETDGAEDSEVGYYARFALQLGAYYTFGFGLQLGADVGIHGFSASVEREVSPGIDQEYTYRGDSGFASLVVGYRF
jgi:hypothetical protein